jgi:hypothetical protein
MDDTAATVDSKPIEGEYIPPPDEKKEPTNSAPPPKPRRKQSKQSAVTSVNLGSLPEEIVEIVAAAPLILTAGIIANRTAIRDANGKVVREGVQLSYDAGAMTATVAAFKAWLATLNIDLTPGYALLAMYAVTIASAIPQAIGDIAAINEAKEKSKSEPTNADKPQDTAESNGAKADSPP